MEMEHPHNLRQNTSPTHEEFEEARQRELARLNVRLFSITGKAFHTTDDLKLLEGDTEDQRLSDIDIVRKWSASSEKYDGGRKLA